MQRKIAKHVCFFLATIFLLIFIVFNSCKKIHDTNHPNPVIPRTDTTKISVDTTKNIDTSRTIVTAKLIDSSGKPLSNISCIFITYNSPNGAFSGSSDSLGNVKTILYNNTTYILRVSQSLNCGTFDYSKKFTTVNTSLDLGNVIIQTNSISVAVTGTVVDCNNNLVKTGNVILEEYNYQDRNKYQTSINPDGTFKLTFTVCKTDSIPVIIYAEDGSGLQIGDRVYFSLHSPQTNIGKIKACNNSDTLQYFNYTIDSTHYSLSSPDNPDVYPGMRGWSFFSGGNQVTGGTFVEFGIDGYLAVNRPGLSLVNFDINPGYSEHGETPPIVNITEDGPIGGYVAGNIKLKIEKLNTQTLDTSNLIHDATCSFRVKRKQ